MLHSAQELYGGKRVGQEENGGKAGYWEFYFGPLFCLIERVRVCRMALLSPPVLAQATAGVFGL